MLFVISAMDKPDALSVRQAARPAHLDYVKETGQVRLAGPYLDNEGNMIGSMLIVEAENLAAAESWAANDPYTKAGVFQSSTVTPWKATVNGCGAAF